MHSGGSIRAGMVFSDLSARVPAVTVRGRSSADVFRGLVGHPQLLRGSGRLASSRLVPRRAFRLLSRLTVPTALDVHDHPTLQASALGVPLEQDERTAVDRAFAEQVAAFHVLLAQSESFAALAGLPRERTLIVPNGTDPSRFPEAALPDQPVVGLVSGANPGRGIETLIEAVYRLRASLPEVRLRMALAATGGASDAYLAELLRGSARAPWIEVASLTYDEVPRFLAGVSVVAVPHPPGEYMDAVVPVKLFDSMMSGRPVMVTPRRETAHVVRTYEAGLIAEGDSPDDLAQCLLRLASDPNRAARLGANGRAAASEHFAWHVLSRRVTKHLLANA
jgi:glycosyltransferase involved in cell wall biosynthesis